MTLKQHIDQLFDTEEVKYEYNIGCDIYKCESPETALRVMAEVCRFMAMNPDEGVNTRISTELAYEHDVYRVLIEDI